MDMEKHVTLVAAINIGFGFLGIFIGLVTLVALIGAGIISQDPEAMKITTIVGVSVACFLILTSIPEIIGGFGLLKRKSWARVLVMIIAVIDLMFIPIGTLIGIYALWVLLNEDTAKLFIPSEKT
jgi:O-antigen/teichoic acid export membrane protein